MQCEQTKGPNQSLFNFSDHGALPVPNEQLFHVPVQSHAEVQPAEDFQNHFNYHQNGQNGQGLSVDFHVRRVKSVQLNKVQKHNQQRGCELGSQNDWQGIDFLHCLLQVRNVCLYSLAFT